MKPLGFLIRLTCAAVAIFALSGCASTDREWQAGYDLDSHRYTAGVKIMPGTGKRSLSLNFTGSNPDLPTYFGEK